MISIIIPAYNEQSRIARTLEAYTQYAKQHNLPWELLVVLNGCTDNTEKIVALYTKKHSNVSCITAPNKGKGTAIKAGFSRTLKKNSMYIGFVDADCATEPQAFHELYSQLIGTGNPDIVIGSRYMPHKNTSRPFYKSIGRKIVYHPLLYVLFGFNFYDIQCGAKIFKRSAVTAITPHLTTTGWSIDPEILYVAKKQNYTIVEVPIKWSDQKESKFTVGAGIKMVADLFRLRYQHR